MESGKGTIRREAGGGHALAMRILVVEDDKQVAEFIREGLEGEEFAVDVAGNAEDAEQRVDGRYDLVILDLNLPRRDGLEVLRSIRNASDSPPVIILTARRGVEDRVKGLDAGADDYLSKPFAFAELLARVRAVARRGRARTETVLKAGELELDRVARVARRQGRVIALTAREFALLEFMVRHAGRSLSRATIAEHVWKNGVGATTNVVDVYINYLRTKIDAGFSRKLIHTVRGEGYQFGRSGEENGHGRQAA